MITVFGGGTSRSTRVPWLIEEMGTPAGFDSSICSPEAIVTAADISVTAALHLAMKFGGLACC